MQTIPTKLLKNNAHWAAKKLSVDPEYFIRSAKGQSPAFLWIGCSDSRVPAEEITETQPGEIFVHRNIANMVVHNDMNFASVLHYAVNVLGVKHIIVCGHYGCGGVLAALKNGDNGIVDNWLLNIKEVYRDHLREMDGLKTFEERADRLVELNVIEQVRNLAKTTVVQKAWLNGDLHIHGWVYNLSNGLLKDLNCTMTDSGRVETLFRHRFNSDVLLKKAQ